jgi:hypothetical protein
MHEHVQGSDGAGEHEQYLQPKHGGLHHVTLLHERLEEELHYIRSVEEDPVEPEVEASGQVERLHGHAEVQSVQQEVLVEDVLVLLRAIEGANQCAGSGVNRVVVVFERGVWGGW